MIDTKSVEERLDSVIKDPLFLVVSGSRLYGTSTPSSDYDLRGWIIPPFEYIIGIKHFECREMEGDYKIYSLHRFLTLALSGDPQISESLFIEGENLKVCSPIAEKVLNLRKHLISNKIFNRIMGYSNGEWRKAMGIKIIPAERTKTEDEVINDVWNKFADLSKQQKDTIIEILYQNREKIVVPSTAGLGIKRREMIKQYGYCIKSAAHSIRLIDEVIELMTTGKLTFPRPNCELLKRIRNGEVDKKEVENIYNEKRKEAENKKIESILIDKPNEKVVWAAYEDIIVKFLKEDKRFNNYLTKGALD